MNDTVTRELRIYTNAREGKIAIAHIADDVTLAAVVFDQEQAEAHARRLVEAIETLQEQHKPFRPPADAAASPADNATRFAVPTDG